MTPAISHADVTRLLRLARQAHLLAPGQTGISAARQLLAVYGIGGTVVAGDGYAGRLGGLCPVQGEGIVDGLPWYFRARHSSWTFSAAEQAGIDPVDVSCGFARGFNLESPYGDGPHDAGYMPDEEAVDFIALAISVLRNERPALAAGTAPA